MINIHSESNFCQYNFLEKSIYSLCCDLFCYSSYQIKIEAERGNGFQGDIAIDDITIKDGACSGIKPTLKPKEPTGKQGFLRKFS